MTVSLLVIKRNDSKRCTNINVSRNFVVLRVRCGMLCIHRLFVDLHLIIDHHSVRSSLLGLWNEYRRIGKSTATNQWKLNFTQRMSISEIRTSIRPVFRTLFICASFQILKIPGVKRINLKVFSLIAALSEKVNQIEFVKWSFFRSWLSLRFQLDLSFVN